MRGYTRSVLCRGEQCRLEQGGVGQRIAGEDSRGGVLGSVWGLCTHTTVGSTYEEMGNLFYKNIYFPNPSTLPWLLRALAL